MTSATFHSNNHGVQIGDNHGSVTAQFHNCRSDRAAYSTEQIDHMCLQALRCPDTLVVKNRLKEGKDKLLRQSFEWVLETPEYRNWRNGNTVCLLWIKGGAGKGKTMMSIGLIEILSQEDNNVVTYFFFQNGDNKLNTLESLIKGLILRLLTQRTELKESLRRRWDKRNESFKKDIDIASWRGLWDILLEMLDGCTLSKVYIVIDALDESQDNQMAEFLTLVVRNGLDNPRIKWLFTSRHLDAAERVLLVGYDQIQVSLELNSKFVSESVQSYIHYKVNELSIRNRYKAALSDQLKDSLSLKAEGTFLWVSLVCKRLEGIRQEEVLATIEELPPGLQHFYDRIMRQLSTGELDDIEQQIRLLKAIILAYRPLKVEEVSVITGLGDDTIKILVNRCASFVRLHDNYVEFVHQSARDYLAGEGGMSILESNTQFGHYDIVLGCLAHLSKRLKINLIGLPRLDSTRKSFTSDKLSSLDYPASFWVQHLQKAHPRVKHSGFIDQGPIGNFLHMNLLEWLECLSLLDRIDDRLLGLFEILMDMAKEEPSTLALMRDAIPFLVHHRSIIHLWPLQIYSACLIFTPESNLVREKNMAKIPGYIRKFPVVQDYRLSLLQIVEGHTRTVRCIALSPDGRQIASGSDDKTIKIWDARTGNPQKTLKGHLDSVNAVVFSSDGKQIASGSSDRTIKLWNSTTTELQNTLEDRSGVHSVAFSPDDRHVASGCDRGTVTLWNIATGEPQNTDAGHLEAVINIVFSPNGKRIAFLSLHTGVITIWNISNGNNFTRLSGSHLKRRSLKFSADGRYIITDYGQINLKDGTEAERVAISNDPAGLSVADQWICYGDVLFFRLPFHMQPACYDVQGDRIAIGLANGRVSSFVFDRWRLHSMLEKAG
ncbi:G-protein beta WD- 40 repeats containing protein [Penicillium angulare]|uniref:G-protein beta WD- 40 repeats containing protein n=1 Tax=Penicillium angulare TaxID=116970 RepID=UPI00253FAF71|nr:G-protein beta WD- 40 repeats containing protein [Penicillium angulare]KAJ5291841.1 G-protein beta WD- 40 repeats containing protein [Penicillium angulare]